MAAPTVTSVTPSTGTAAGGTTVLIVGTGFGAATAVTFGGVSADFEVSSATLLAATTPPNTTGAALVVVTNADGSSSDVVNFTYTATGAIFTVAEARAFDKGQLGSTTVFSGATITAKEVAIRGKFERIIGVALTPTASTEYYDGDGTNELYLRHHNPWAEATPRGVTLTSVTVIATDDTETAFTTAELADCVKYPDKLVRRSGVFTKGSRNIKVVYTHGYATVPEDLKNIALQVLHLQPPEGLLPGDVPSSAYEGMDGTIKWGKVKDPGRGRWYGDESIDGTLREHRDIETLPGIA